MDKIAKIYNQINIQRTLLYNTIKNVKNLYDPAIIIESQKLDKLILEYVKAKTKNSM
jgi:hypothetical protein